MVEQPQTAQATWHEVITYSGVKNDTRSINTKGNRIKVVMSTTPTYANTSSYMTTDILNGNNVLATGTLYWGQYDPVKTAEKTLEVTAPPGTYWIRVTAQELQGWTIKIYDYY